MKKGKINRTQLNKLLMNNLSTSAARKLTAIHSRLFKLGHEYRMATIFFQLKALVEAGKVIKEKKGDHYRYRRKVV